MLNITQIQGDIISDKITYIKNYNNKNDTRIHFKIHNEVEGKRSNKVRVVEVECVAFNEVADYIHENFRIGDNIIVTGRLSVTTDLRPEIVLAGCNVKGHTKKMKLINKQ